jgi:hypothetical protein
MTGYAELDANGRWDTAPGYGQAWLRQSGCCKRGRTSSARLWARRAEAGSPRRSALDRLNVSVPAGSAATKPEEIVNAALMSLRHGGSVTFVKRELLPPSGICAAILRC